MLWANRVGHKCIKGMVGPCALAIGIGLSPICRRRSKEQACIINWAIHCFLPRLETSRREDRG